MNKKWILSLILIILLFISIYIIYYYAKSISETNSGLWPVHNITTGLNYQMIQEAIDASVTRDGHIIRVDSGIYHEHITVYKSISIIGENRTTTIIDGEGIGITVHIVAIDVTLKEFTIRNSTIGIYLQKAHNSLIFRNNVTLTGNAILIYDSNNCTIHQNIAKDNAQRGILLSNSHNFTVVDNYVCGNKMYGLNINASENGLIKLNTAQANYYDGIGLVSSSRCSVIENNLINNTIYGIIVDSSENNTLYHNNFRNNGIQAVDGTTQNQWDNSIEGNYWDNYNGDDLNNDGIGDVSVTIVNGKDNYPLMGIFHAFTITSNYRINIITNSIIKKVTFFAANNTLRILISNSSSTQSLGFCRIAIPKALMSQSYIVTIDGTSLKVFNFNYVYEDIIYRCIYFAYTYPIERIDIAPQF